MSYWLALANNRLRALLEVLIIFHLVTNPLVLDVMYMHPNYKANGTRYKYWFSVVERSNRKQLTCLSTCFYSSVHCSQCQADLVVLEASSKLRTLVCVSSPYPYQGQQPPLAKWLLAVAFSALAGNLFLSESSSVCVSTRTTAVISTLNYCIL